MEKTILNHLVRSTTNKFLWYFIKSFTYDKEKNDYLIEYSNAYERVNGSKECCNNYTYKSYLSDFPKSEGDTIYMLIHHALKKESIDRNKKIVNKNVLMLETVYV